MNNDHTPVESNIHESLPRTFRSVNDNTGSGALVYIVLVPFLTVALYALIGGILFAVLQPLGLDELLPGRVLAAVLLPLAFVVVTWFCWTDYRRRAGARIDVANDRVTVASAFYERHFEHTDIENVRIVPERSKDACRLELKDGRRIHLLSEVATLDQLRPAFEASLIPELAGRLWTALRNGATIDLRESKVRAVLRIFAGMFGLCLGLIFFYLVPFVPWMPGLDTSLRRIRRGWRGVTGGFAIRGDSVVRSSLTTSFPIELDSLIDVDEDQIGLTLRFRDGDRTSVSVFAPNYWLVSWWLRERTDALPG